MQWYGRRWGIATWHKVLKSGCKVEDGRLEAERLKRYLTLFSIIGVRLIDARGLPGTRPTGSAGDRGVLGSRDLSPQRHQEEQYLQRRSKRRREITLFSEKRFGRVDCRIDINIFDLQQPTPQSPCVRALSHGFSEREFRRYQRF